MTVEALEREYKRYNKEVALRLDNFLISRRDAEDISLTLQLIVLYKVGIIAKKHCNIE